MIDFAPRLVEQFQAPLALARALRYFALIERDDQKDDGFGNGSDDEPAEAGTIPYREIDGMGCYDRPGEDLTGDQGDGAAAPAGQKRGDHDAEEDECVGRPIT